MCAVQVRPAVGTDRLVLRAPVDGDALMLRDFANDLGVAGMTSTMPHPFTLADAEACLGKAAGGDPRKRVGLVVEHRQFGPIGLVQIHEKAGPELRLDGRPFWGRGYATRRWARRCAGPAPTGAGVFVGHCRQSGGRPMLQAGFLTGDVEVGPAWLTAPACAPGDGVAGLMKGHSC